MTKSVNIRSEDAIQARLDKRAYQKQIINKMIPYVGLIFIFLFFLIVTKGSLVSGQNIENLINQCFTLTIICVGAAFVHGHGGSDFSVGATCGCAQLVMGALMTMTELPLWLCLLLGILTAVAGAAILACVSVFFKVPVFVGSMCIRYVFSGILLTATQKLSIFISQTEYSYMNNTWLKAMILVLFIGVGYYLFELTSLGKSLRAIGGNENTAKQAGIKIKKNIIIAYLILGLCVGVAAMFQMFRNGSVTSNSGNGVELNMMMAIVLGGFPMRGGERAKLSAAIVGALTVTILVNGLTLWGVDVFLVNGIKGILFVAIVALSYDRSMGKLVS